MILRSMLVFLATAACVTAVEPWEKLVGTWRAAPPRQKLKIGRTDSRSTPQLAFTFTKRANISVRDTNDPFAGEWLSNIGERRVSEELTFTRTDAGLEVRSSLWPEIRTEEIFDEMDHPVTGTMLTVACRVVSNSVFEVTNKQDGKVMLKETIEISPDAKTMQITWRSANGQVLDGMSYEKIRSSPSATSSQRFGPQKQ